jgi:hypothetical protein
MFGFAVRSSLRVDRLVVHDEQCVPYQFTESAVAELHVVHVHAEGLAEMFSWSRAFWRWSSGQCVFAVIKRNHRNRRRLILFFCAVFATFVGFSG